MAALPPSPATHSRPGQTVTVGSRSPDETLALGVALAIVSEPGDLICLWGDLGAGKTVLAKGFGAGLGVTSTISSPTFVLMGEYEGRLPLFHIDLYRLADAADALAGGLIDERQAAGVTLVEWPDRLGEALPAERVDVVIEGTAEHDREVTVATPSGRLERYVRAVRTRSEAS